MKKIINSLAICNECGYQSITYGIKKGNFTYYCNTCKKEKNKNEIHQNKKQNNVQIILIKTSSKIKYLKDIKRGKMFAIDLMGKKKIDKKILLEMGYKLNIIN